jgi:hypothetical protein
MPKLGDIKSLAPVVRTSVILTNSYVYSSAYKVDGFNQLVLLVDFTIGSLTSGEISVEFSNDGTNWYSETFSVISAGVSTDSIGSHTFTATGKRRISIPMSDAYVRVGAKGTGTVTSSLMGIVGVIGLV